MNPTEPETAYLPTHLSSQSPWSLTLPLYPRIPPKDLLHWAQPWTDKPDQGHTPGCAGCELSVKVEGVIGLGHGWLERWLDLTTVELLQGEDMF